MSTITSQFCVTTVEQGPKGDTGEQGPAGANACRIDIANEYDVVPTSSKGSVIQQTNVICAVTFLDGLNTVAVPTLTIDAIPIKSSGTSTTLSPTQTSESGGRIKILTWNFTDVMELQERYEINISCTYGGTAYKATMTIASSMGEPRRLLSFTKYVINFARKEDNTLDPAYKDTKLSITFDDYDDTVEKTVAASGLIVRYNTNGVMPASKTAGTAWNTANGASGITFPTTDTMRIANGTTVNEISVALFSQNGILYDRETIPIMKDGANGASGDTGHTGRWYYYAGVYDGTPGHYKMEDMQSPYVSVGSGASAEFYMLDFGGEEPTSFPKAAWQNPTDGGQTNWTKITGNKFSYYIAEAIFGRYAHLGSFIINEDWMISQYGTLYNPGNSATAIDTDTKASTLYNGKVPYAWFDGNYPNSSHSGVYNFAPNFAVNAKTGKSYQNDAYIKGQIVATSGQITGEMVVGTYGSGNRSIKIMPTDGKVGAAIKGYNGTTEAFMIGFVQIGGTSTDIVPYIDLGSNNYFQRMTLQVASPNSGINLHCNESANTEILISKTTSGTLKTLNIGLNSSGKIVLAASALSVWPTSAGSVGQVYLDNGFLKVRTS